jgi:hypothetical protein
MSCVTAVPDPRSLTREELTVSLKELTERERAVSDERRDLQARIDTLRSELVNRLRDEGKTVISGTDFLDPGPAGVREPRRPTPHSGLDAVALPQPEAPDVEADATPKCDLPPC